MRVEVDLGKCTGHGICESIAEDVVEVSDEGMVHIHRGDHPERPGTVWGGDPAPGSTSVTAMSPTVMPSPTTSRKMGML